VKRLALELVLVGAVAIFVLAFLFRDLWRLP
jgi:ABC-type proline/glycine betaine transport system permease subunit